MTYVILEKDIAIRNGIIKEHSYFPSNGTEVMFKKDLLVSWGENNKVDFDFKEVKTDEALKITEEWRKI